MMKVDKILTDSALRGLAAVAVLFVDIQGGPTKVVPTDVFLRVTFECPDVI